MPILFFVESKKRNVQSKEAKFKFNAISTNTLFISMNVGNKKFSSCNEGTRHHLYLKRGHSDHFSFLLSLNSCLVI